MRIIVSTINGGLNDRVNQAFGRTPTFTIVDVENGEITSIQVVPNPGYSQPRGAGVTAAQFAIDQGAEAVIAGQFGPNSYGVLQAAGIRMYSAPATMTVREAIAALLRGELQPGIQGGTGGMDGYGGGMGRGMRRGRGMGRGMGRGRGGGYGRGGW
ncbi:putative dinitrogenase iron-molybdenum cofactor biosynthesis protein 1 [Thermococcus cleftensis]|uniref:Dinitrogenase iron-molybdenum cofactor biosynthesis protein 1 n=1 Tax=Thermococcus cleftensis (strain DSM 27260 / KACC 17922 / CL1) TaxID=163003 RepID=I3ZW95_THECF|nr:NifB/NifX family molybdenum-iron cluster-binding protein [Thermococcus cleftensis]AFL95979.1 putative dinitrogenase iron-molybdenum cofactor biosynthesis protein 1 [Thermococcus cleftensis]